MEKTVLYILLTLLFYSCNDDRKPIDPIINKSSKDSTEIKHDSLVSTTDTVTVIKDSAAKETDEELAQLATILKDTVPDAGPYLKLCKISESNSVTRGEIVDSLCLSRVIDSSINLEDTTVTYVGFTIDFDNDSDSDLVVMKIHNIDTEPTSNIIDIAFYCKNGRRYIFNAKTTISDVIDPCEVYRSIDITNANSDSYPDFCINSSSGGSGGGNSCYFMIWNGKKLQPTTHVSTGKWAWTEDIDKDGICEVILVNYVSENGPYLYHNDKYGVKVFQLAGYSLKDVSKDFYTYKKELLNNL